jgi:hypothetical protein
MFTPHLYSIDRPFGQVAKNTLKLCKMKKIQLTSRDTPDLMVKVLYRTL